jgi:hypothetical protein
MLMDSFWWAGPPKTPIEPLEAALLELVTRVMSLLQEAEVTVTLAPRGPEIDFVVAGGGGGGEVGHG